MSKLQINIDKGSDVWKVKVGGSIDEDADFTPYFLHGASKIQLYLSGITSINSCGIREWIKWISTAEGSQLEFYECPKIIVDQINMVQGFLPNNARVRSFFVPYYNESSETEKDVLFTYGKEFSDAGVNPPKEVLDNLGNALEMDVIEAKYFKFLQKG